LNGSSWQGSHFNDCQFNESSIQQLAIKKSAIKKIQWHSVNQSGIHIYDSVIENNEFIGGVISMLSFTGSKTTKLHFETIQATGVTWDECELNALTIKHTKMASCRFKKCDLNHSQVSDSSLPKLVIVDSTINALTLLQNDMKSFRMRRLTRVYALQAVAVNFESSSVTDCVFEVANLFNCELNKSVWQNCALITTKLKSNKAVFSRFIDCSFVNSLLENNDFFTAIFKRSQFNNSEILGCNLYRANFYHACSNGLKMKHCMLEDPLPIGFWERWRHEGDVSCV